MNLSATCIVILCSFLIRTSIIGTDHYYYHEKGHLQITLLCFAVSQGIAYLLYPLLGWLSDVYFTRYKVIRLAFITMSIAVSVAVLVTLAILIDDGLTYKTVSSIILLTLITPGLLTMVLSLGLFEANVIQFGMDQLLESSSDQLSSFIHWYYWSRYAGHFILFLLSAALVVLQSHCVVAVNIKHPIDTIQNYFMFFMSLLQLILAAVGLFVLIRFKKRLNIEKPGHNPLMLIYKVLKYAWKHTFPENRSAFTYWENDIPPRIDLGKNKYGGPFTTEEVEDTKSFFRILFVLFSLLGFHLSGHGYSTVQQLMMKECPNTWLLILIGDPMNLTMIVIFTGVPLYQLINVRYRQKYIPNIFKRMGLGLLCCLLKVIIEIALQVTQKLYATEQCSNNRPLFNCYSSISQVKDNDSCIYLTNCRPGNSIFLILLVVPQVLQGLSFLLVFLSAIEFICAQAPLRLKGLLIGLWYASLSVHYLLVDIPDIYIPLTDGTTWVVIQEAKAFLIALSLIFFVHVSEQYRYRVRDEVVNEQYLIEEIYERRIRLAAEMEDEAVENELLVSSNASTQQYH